MDKQQLAALIADAESPIELALALEIIALADNAQRWHDDAMKWRAAHADAEREIARYGVALTEALAWLENSDNLVDRSLALQHRIAATLAEKP